MSRKVFTAGEVLAAADVNSFLMDQTVMSFAGTAARGSAIPSPVEGMYTHLEDTDRLEFYNGSAWKSPFGTTLVATSTFSSTTSVIVSNCFSADYEVYKVYFKSTTNGGAAKYQLRTGATTQTTNYSSSIIYWDGSSVLGANRSSASFEVFSGATTDSNESTFVNPFDTRTTSFKSFDNSIGSVGITAGYLNTSTSYESLVLSFSNSTSGTISIYGMRKDA